MTDPHLRKGSRRREPSRDHATDPLRRPLPREFYQTSLLDAARSLLGQHLVREVDGELRAGRIVEVEAYGGTIDPTAHSFAGPTERSSSMFLECGHAYVYRSYGVHWCLNVVAGEREQATAILLRALRPVRGEESMRRARERPRGPRLADEQLGQGPGNLARALAVDRSLDGHDLVRGEALWIAAGPVPKSVRWSERIGLGDHASAVWSWRAFLSDEPSVSRKPQNRRSRAEPWPSFAEARDLGLRHRSAEHRATRLQSRRST